MFASEGEAGWFAALLNPAAMLGAALSGWMADSLGRRGAVRAVRAGLPRTRTGGVTPPLFLIRVRGRLIDRITLRLKNTKKHL